MVGSYTITHLEETRALAKTMAGFLADKHHGGVAFVGDLGAGKTTLIRMLIGEMGGNELEVSSPTYALVNEYDVPGMQVAHFDFYRLKEAEEALDFGVEEYFEGPWLCLMEWPEKIEAIRPPVHFEVNIKALENGDRQVDISAKK